MFKFLKWVVKKTVTLFVIAIIVAIGVIIYLKGQPLPDQYIPYTTKVYSRDHQLIDAIAAGENRIHVPLANISEHLVNATIAIEDHRFYKHFGFDFKGIARAVYVNFQTNDRSQGGSTITQQLAKNLYLTNDKTWQRKFEEMILTAQLELHYSKDYILEKYLNLIYFGHSSYGVEAASQLFFAKSVSDLTLAESALLAGVPKGPKFYSPFWDLDNAISRQHLVLSRMLENNFITDEQYIDAINEQLEFNNINNTDNGNISANSSNYFRDYVLLELAKLGFDEQRIHKEGLEIITTLNLDMQKAAANLIDSHLIDYPNIQAALLSIEPSSGDILAMIGGKDYNTSPFNRTTASRQAGSTFKPFVYLTALDHGLTPMSKLKSEPARFTYDQGRQVYTPKNFNDFYYNDDIHFLKAISVSDNVVAVKANLMVRPEKVKETAQSLGIKSYLQAEPSLALGSFPVTPLEMTTAYATIVNQGIRVEPRSILEVRNNRGRLLYTSQPIKQHVHEPETLFILIDMMRSVFEQGGTGARVASLLPFDVAGKTGTTDTDAWMIGFTPENVTSVWVGYDRDRFISRQESYLATPIWANYMAQVSGQTIAVSGKASNQNSLSNDTIQHHQQFLAPRGVVPLKICLDTGQRAEPDCKNTRTVYFLAGNLPD